MDSLIIVVSLLLLFMIIALYGVMDGYIEALQEEIFKLDLRLERLEKRMKTND